VRRRKRVEHAAGHERWLVSYADFITLLFAFFTTLYAISNVDLQKMHRLVSSLQVAFDTKGLPAQVHKTGLTDTPSLAVKSDVLRGGVNSPTLAAGVEELPKLPPRVLAELGRGYLEATLSDVRSRLLKTLKPAIDVGRVSLDTDPRGLVVSIRENGTFRTGSADLSDSMKGLIAEVGASLRDIDNFVRVEGHTDDVPIHTARFASNWELSTARATAVVAFLVQGHALPPDRLSAAGYAEFHPRVPNADEASRSTNRRVDIVILNQLTSRAEEPGAPGGNP
jgi:chemotaxis protein MotB